MDRKEVPSGECNEHTAKKEKSPGYIIDFEAKKLRLFTLLETPRVSQNVFQI